jgi:hypothetical protein
VRNKRFRPSIEILEDRLTPSTLGGPWLDPEHLSLSFVPDGTMASSAPSNLLQTFNAEMPGQNWKDAIVQAFQTWGVNSNINLHVVNDGGQPLGSPGPVQGDPRFGDIRIAGQNLGPTVAAIGTGFSANGNRWSGTVIFNTSDLFGIGNPNAYDLFTVALHEAGHVFGLPDQTTDPTSVMYQTYSGPVSGLSTADLANFQAINGTRQPDSFQNGSGNHSLAHAATLDNNHLSVQADIGAVGANEYFQFHYDGNMVIPGAPLTIQVQTSGVSLLEPSLTVVDANGIVVGSASASDPLNGDLAVQLSNPVKGMNYYIDVGSATASVFGIGGFSLNIIPQGYRSFQNVINLDDNHLVTTSTLSGLAQPDYYRWQYDGHVGTPGAPVTIQVQGLTLVQPTLTVYDGNYNVVGTAAVSSSFGGTLNVTIANPVMGMNYYLAVGTAGASFFGVGCYTLSIIPQGVTLPSSQNGELTAANGILTDSHQQHHYQNAENLHLNTNVAMGLAFYAQGGISDPSTGDFYQIQSPNTPGNAPVEMMVTAWQLSLNGLAPQVTVYDDHGNVVSSQVSGNANGVFSVDIPNAVPNQHYIVEVSALNPSGANATGNYAVGVEFNNNAFVNLTTFVTGKLTAASSQQWLSLQVNNTCGLQLVLAAQSPGQGNAQVEMIIYGANGASVVNLTTAGGQQAVSGTVYLAAGTYTIYFVEVIGDCSKSVTFQLSLDILSDPMGPAPVPNGTPSGSSTTTPSSTTTASAPVVAGSMPVHG